MPTMPEILRSQMHEDDKPALGFISPKEAADRIAELEATLGELLDAFNPKPRVSTRLTIWGRAAMVLDGTPDQDDKVNSN